MHIGTHIYSTIKLSRNLTFDEIDLFNSLKVNVGDSCFIDEKCRIIGPTFEYTNPWKPENQILKLNDFTDELFFFVESLIYLIKNFFNPLKIQLEGYLISTDEIFGDISFLQINKNEIVRMIDIVRFFENLTFNKNPKETFEIIKDYLKN